ncbi:MAG TPA: sigma-54 dependent transcriptional regulator [Bryobacteraceae bacterium]
MVRIALFSKDQKLQPLLAPALGRDFQVIAEPDGDRLRVLIAESSLDVLLLDLDSELHDIPEQIAFYDEACDAGIAVIVMTDDASRTAAADLVQRGAHGYCRKPPAVRELKALIRRAYEHTDMKRELKSRRALEAAQPEAAPEPFRCDGLIGSSSEMRAAYDLIRRVAPLNNSVLITGESGTGKELIARAIHNLGDRTKAPFVAVSCGAIPETLIESELFGHEKGAFTGTTGTRIGYFEQAGNGTLFLDEIGELSPQTQVKLLRVLQQREFMRLGSSRPVPLKARVLFATHRDLSRMVEEGKFRLDLYYRINVMTIKAPSLADHVDDIPSLTQFFIGQYADSYNKWVTGIAPDALATLQAYDWPGNVRELENVIQSSIICADGQIIQVKDLPERLQEPVLSLDEDLVQCGSFERLIRDFKVKVAIKALEDCHGNKTLAARSLSISRAYLHRLVRLSGDTETAAVDVA